MNVEIALDRYVALHRDLSNVDAAERLYQEIIKRYPDSDEAGDLCLEK
jgi:TolA-binding protein